MEIPKNFIAINEFFEKYGRIIASIFINLIGVALMLFPGVVFALFLFNLTSLFIGHGLAIKWGEFLPLVIFAFVSWYIGVGVYKNNDPDRDASAGEPKTGRISP